MIASFLTFSRLDSLQAISLDVFSKQAYVRNRNVSRKGECSHYGYRHSVGGRCPVLSRGTHRRCLHGGGGAKEARSGRQAGDPGANRGQDDEVGIRPRLRTDQGLPARRGSRAQLEVHLGVRLQGGGRPNNARVVEWYVLRAAGTGIHVQSVRLGGRCAGSGHRRVHGGVPMGDDQFDCPGEEELSSHLSGGTLGRSTCSRARSPGSEHFLFLRVAVA